MIRRFFPPEQHADHLTSCIEDRAPARSFRSVSQNLKPIGQHPADYAGSEGGANDDVRPPGAHGQVGAVGEAQQRNRASHGQRVGPGIDPLDHRDAAADSDLQERDIGATLPLDGRRRDEIRRKRLVGIRKLDGDAGRAVRAGLPQNHVATGNHEAMGLHRESGPAHNGSPPGLDPDKGDGPLVLLSHARVVDFGGALLLGDGGDRRPELAPQRGNPFAVSAGVGLPEPVLKAMLYVVWGGVTFGLSLILAGVIF